MSRRAAAIEIVRPFYRPGRLYGWLWRTKLEHCRLQCYILDSRG